MEGYILDAYTDLRKNKIVLWLKGAKTVRVEFNYMSSLYIGGYGLEEAERRLSAINGIDLVFENVRTAPSMKSSVLLRVSSRNLSLLRRIAEGLQTSKSGSGLSLYDVDIPYEQRFMAENGIFPFAHISVRHGSEISCEESVDDISYEFPPLNTCHLGISFRESEGAVSVASATVDDETISGDEEHVLMEISRRLNASESDVIITHGGDSGKINELYSRARRLGLGSFTLGRAGGLQSTYRSKSYSSYGRVLYKPSPALLMGRIHIDAENSFLYDESGMDGLVEVSRLSLIPLQRMARVSPGTAISGMENVEAMKRRIAVPYRKNRSEDFKNAADLVVADRGGFIYTPQPGFNTDVYGVDFSSLYPSIMEKWNISVETLNCGCCRQDGIRVPELNYHFCRKYRGIVPAVVGRLISRRRRYRTVDDPAAANRSKALKWVLVTSFGYTGYRNAKFGSIECHEAINAFGREILLTASEIAGRMKFRVLHGIVDSLWLKGEGDIDEFVKSVELETGLPIDIEGRYRWIVFLNNKGNGEGSLNRYYGELENGKMKVRGIEIRRSDTPEVVRFAQRILLEKLRGSSSSDDFMRRAMEGITAVREIVRSVKQGDYPAEEMLITKRTSQRVEEYAGNSEQKKILVELGKRGITVNAGEAVRYVSGRNSSGRTAIPEHAADIGNYDASHYVSLIARSISTMLYPFGLTEKKVRLLLTHF